MVWNICGLSMRGKKSILSLCWNTPLWISTLGDVTNAGWIRRGFVPSNHVSAPTKSQLSQEAKTELLDRRVKTADWSCKVVSNFWISTRGSLTQMLQMCRGATCTPMPSSAKPSTDRPFTQGTKRCTSSRWSKLAALLLRLVEKRAVKCKTQYKVVFTKGQILHNCCCFNYIINTPDKDVLCLPPWKWLKHFAFSLLLQMEKKEEKETKKKPIISPSLSLQ